MLINMKIENAETRVELKSICLFLNKSEANELRDTLDILIKAEDAERHAHVLSSDYTREIAVVVTS